MDTVFRLEKAFGRSLGLAETYDLREQVGLLLLIGSLNSCPRKGDSWETQLGKSSGKQIGGALESKMSPSPCNIVSIPSAGS